MTVQILMPALSPTMEEGAIAKWLVKEGDIVKAGDVIAEIETDKAIMELESYQDGKISKLLVLEGTTAVLVNSPIALFSEETDDSVNEEKQAGNQTKNLRVQNELVQEVSSKTKDSKNVSTKNVEITVREALRDAMAEEMRSDKHVFLMGEEVAQYQGAYKVSQGLLDEFGAERVIDTPITEHGFTGLAIGAAFGGLKPIVEFMTFNFALQAMDQIINSAAKTLYMSGGQMGAQIVFRGPNGAASRVGAQHSQDFAAWFSHIPGLKVCAPYSADDAKGLLKSAIRDPNPVIFLENEILYNKKFITNEESDHIVQIGKAKIRREGSDVTLVSFGIGVEHTLKAAEELDNIGINAEVIDLRSLRPMDTEAIINSVKKTNRCVTIEEGFPIGSIGNYISAMLVEKAFDYLDAPILNCTGKDIPMPYAANLEKLSLITVKEIVEAAQKVTYKDGIQ
ncbi:MAG: pyruvate dehydrogenase complex E1 component subunit beta [Rhodobacteraceae bacterium]|jgi:pyruvate dehydrogenase E1 component beta subunit|nr:pyruvate dehydrogenase complex E1 component subunit beta [Paracoccaceae bacterium]MBV03586.1 pyruvate dehydrogenase complex E1 component subunit beta [Paracoccaceae bacterium]|tara:strand:- start:8788 stop:10143 length:1356 start_codon:yes stop_codon:yes gene_type:complete